MLEGGTCQPENWSPTETWSVERDPCSGDRASAAHHAPLPLSRLRRQPVLEDGRRYLPWSLLRHPAPRGGTGAQWSVGLQSWLLVQLRSSPHELPVLVPGIQAEAESWCEVPE